MLRITEVKRGSDRITLRVEGWIASQNSGLLESETTGLLDRGFEVRLECSGVTYVDSKGAETLRSLSQRRSVIVGLPPFILEAVARDLL